MTAYLTHKYLAHNGISLAYETLAGTSPTVMFLPGFKSDMQGSKALALRAHCQTIGQAMLKFDYSGHGQSGGAFTAGTISTWLSDTLKALDDLTTGPVILVGSSMGGWLAVLTALARPERIHALLLIAPAPDFTHWGIEAGLTDTQRRALATQGYFEEPSEYGPDPYVITRALIDDGKQHLLLEAPIDFTGPVRIIHGLADPDVPSSVSVRLMARLSSLDVRLQMIKDGDHRLSRQQDIGLLCSTLDELTSTAPH